MPSLANLSVGAAARPYELAAKYTVSLQGSYWRVMKDDGTFTLSTSSLEVAFNDEAMAGLTAARAYPETVLIKGRNGSVDGKLLLDPYTTCVVDGSLKEVNGLDDNMFANNGALAAGSVSLIGLTPSTLLDGNGANQTVEKSLLSFDFNAKNSNCIRNFRILNARGWSATLANCGISWFDSMIVQDSYGGFNLDGIFDCMLDRICVSGSAFGGGAAGYHNLQMLRYTVGNIFSNWYIGGLSNTHGDSHGIYMKGAQSNHFGNMTIADCTGNGVLMEDDTDYCLDNIFEGGRIQGSSQGTGNTCDNVNLAGNSHHNSFTGIKNRSALAGNRARYNFNESAATCNSNEVLGGFCIGGQTGTVRLQGAQSTKTAVIEA